MNIQSIANGAFFMVTLVSMVVGMVTSLIGDLRIAADVIIDATVNGIPLIGVVFGLVAFVKSLGVTGRALTITSMVLGLVLGVLYVMSTAMPTTFAGWFAAIIYGLVIGLVASGFYDQMNRWIRKE